jgi:pimeloyl-ACP methyl ester carboxylesterase
VPIVEVNGEKLHFIQNGSGPALILLHGIGARADLWADLIGQLSARYAVSAFDLRGHGASTCNRELSVAAMADDLIKAADQLQLPPFHLAGVSLGGAVALSVAAAAPERVKSLTVGSIGLGSGGALADEIYGIREAVHYLQPADFAEQVSQDVLNPDAPSERLEALASSIQSLGRQRYLKALEALAAAGLDTAAAKVKARTLVLHGEQDQLIAKPSADALAKAVGGARRVEVPDAGHLLDIDNPEAFAAELTGFLAG